MADQDPESAASPEETMSGEPVEVSQEPSRAPSEPLRDGWRDRWQLPTLLASLLVLSVGLYVWVRGAPPPDFPGAFNHVQKLIDAAKYEEAIAFLNDPIRVNMEPLKVPEDVLARYFTLSGDAIYLGQKARGVDVPENHDSVISSYRAARGGLGAELSVVQQFRLADTLISLGRIAEAVKELDELPEAASQERHALMRRIIAQHLSGKQSTLDSQEIMRMLSDLRTDPRVTIEDRLWAAARQAEMRLSRGFAEEALTRLIPEVQRFASPRSKQMGELYVLMGDASLELGRLSEARNYYLLALEVIDRLDLLAGRALVGVGKASQLQNDDEEATEWFSEAIARFPFSAPTAAAQLGLGEVLSRRGQLDDSISSYESAIEGLSGNWSAGKISAEDLATSLGQRHDEWLAQNNPGAALRFARLVERIYPGDKMPVDVLARIARTQRIYAESLMEGAMERPDGTIDVTELDPVTVEEARRHYRGAAVYFARHAQARLLGNPAESSESLWMAGESYDRAGDLDSAIAKYHEFITTQEESPRHQEATFRLARAHQARGEYTRAAELFESLIRGSPESLFAYRSYVPLAQAYTVREDAANVQRAERLLRDVLTSGIFEPDAPEFRAAKIELGRLYRRIGDHDRAIAHLREALQRYPELESNGELVFALADSLRQSAEALGRELQVPRPPGERADLRRRRGAELREALEGFTRVREMVASQDPRRMSDLEHALLRHATLYRGDCAFDLAVLTRDVPVGLLKDMIGEPVKPSDEWYELAVAYYDTAAQQYANDPVSLTAMVQIVNAYMEMGKVREARTAHERAKSRLAELPESAFERDQTTMTRDAWESWLAATVRLDRLAETQP